MHPIVRFSLIVVFLAGLFTVGVLGTSTSLTHVWTGYLVIGAAGVLSALAIFRRTSFSVPGWCLGAFFAAVAYFLVRAMNSPVAYFAREDGALLVTCFIAYIVFLSVLDGPRDRLAILHGFVGLMAFNLLVAAIQFFGDPGFRVIPTPGLDGGDRIRGLFAHPDHFAGFLALGIPLVAAHAIFGKQRPAVRLLWVALAILSGAGIVGSGSLLGALGAFAGLGVLGLLALAIAWSKLDGTSRRGIIWGLAFTVMLAAGFVSSQLSTMERLVEARLLDRDGIVLPELWRAAALQFGEAPAIGTGSRTFYFYGGGFEPATEGDRPFPTAFVHNEFLQVLGEYGMLGLFCGLSLFAIHLHNGICFALGYGSIRGRQGSPLPSSDHLAMVTGSVSFLGALGVLALFDCPLHVPAIALPATMMLGILACPDPMSDALRAEEETSCVPGGGFLFVGRGLAFGCGVAMTLFGFVFGRSEWHLEMARVSLEEGVRTREQLSHLQVCRRIDPLNPAVGLLSARWYADAVSDEMSPAVRSAYVALSERHRAEAAGLYFPGFPPREVGEDRGAGLADLEEGAALRREPFRGEIRETVIGGAAREATTGDPSP